MLHDIAMTDKSRDRSKHNEYSAEIAEQLLRENNYPEEKVQFVKKCVLNHSSKKSEHRTPEEERTLVSADCLSHFESINNLYNLAHNVMELSDDRSLKFIQYKYDKVMNANTINDIIEL